MNQLLSKIKKVKFKDIYGIFIFLLVLIPSFFYKQYLKLRKKELWLVCEKENMARDNGKVFYKYLKNKHPEINSYYAINTNCKDYEDIKKYNNIIKWSSIKHYFIYMSATKNISSHKEGNPNQTLFTILHLYFHLYNNRVFLQHGILYQDFKMFHKENTRFKLFITGAKPEYEYVNRIYGYDKGEVKYTGLARFDELHEWKTDKKCILLIPTWRRWLNSKEKFIKSCYYKRLQSFINNKDLWNFLERNDKYLYFYPHISTQMYIDEYTTNCNRVKILKAEDVNIQDVLKQGALLITDYSSISSDFAYMKKPIIYYQYDSNEFYKKHFQKPYHKSYFDFKKDGFGKVLDNEDDLIKLIEYYSKNDFELEKNYIERINNFFELYDKNNCERIFKEIMRCE